MALIQYNSSYLTENFFKQYPTSVMKVTAKENTDKSSSQVVADANDDDFKKAPDMSIHEEEEEEEKNPVAILQTVYMHYIEISWLTTDEG